jgi:mannose-6-phosphate isomerase-like protein (cupin superfamily)
MVSNTAKAIAARSRVPTENEGGRQMPSPYTLKNLAEVADSAPKFGLAEVQQAHFANDELSAEGTGVSYHRLRPGKRQGFAHRHENAEEIYVVLAGSGRVKLDGEIVPIEKLDALRVAPQVIRGFEAGPDGLDLLAFGPRHDGDGEVLAGWWTD